MDLTEYRKRFEQANKDFDLFQKEFLLKQGIMVRDSAIRRTPVDTGYLRTSWYVGNERKEKKKYQSGEKEGSYYKKTIQPADIRSIGTSKSINVGNNAYYALI